MKPFTFAVLFLLPILLWGQDKKNAFNILGGIGLANQITGEEYHRLKNRNTKESIPLVDRILLANANYRFGFDYQRKIIKGFHAKIGARLVNWSETWTHNRTKINHKDYYYIGIPISLQYKFGNKALQPYVEIGGSPLFYLQNNTSTYTSLPEPFIVHLALSPRVGFSYQISVPFAIFAQISSHFRLTSNEYDITPYEIGLEVGGSFCF